MAIDINPEAVKLSNENAKRLGYGSDRYTALNIPISNFDIKRHGNDIGFDIIISNPPYIPKSDMDALPKTVLNYEDYDALCGGDDGLDVVNVILEKFSSLTKNRKNPQLFMEVDSSHPMLLMNREKINGENDSSVMMIHKDFSGTDRFISLSQR